MFFYYIYNSGQYTSRKRLRLASSKYILFQKSAERLESTVIFRGCGTFFDAENRKGKFAVRGRETCENLVSRHPVGNK